MHQQQHVLLDLASADNRVDIKYWILEDLEMHPFVHLCIVGQRYVLHKFDINYHKLVFHGPILKLDLLIDC